MIDLSKIGKEGLMIQYEDIISMIGYNVVKQFQKKHVNEKISRMSDEDILLSYINRESYSISEWLKTNFEIEGFDIDMFKESQAALKPNALYAYKMFDTAYKNGVRNLMVYSDNYSKTIENYLSTFQIPIKYVHGDIVPVLKEKNNITFVTSSIKNIHKCMDVNVPFVLTIIDDYAYVADIIVSKFDDKLRKNGVFVVYTGIVSAGIVIE